MTRTSCDMEIVLDTSICKHSNWTNRCNILHCSWKRKYKFIYYRVRVAQSLVMGTFVCRLVIALTILLWFTTFPFGIFAMLIVMLFYLYLMLLFFQILLQTTNSSTCTKQTTGLQVWAKVIWMVIYIVKCVTGDWNKGA